MQNSKRGLTLSLKQPFVKHTPASLGYFTIYEKGELDNIDESFEDYAADESKYYRRKSEYRCGSDIPTALLVAALLDLEKVQLKKFFEHYSSDCVRAVLA